MYWEKNLQAEPIDVNLPVRSTAGVLTLKYLWQIWLRELLFKTGIYDG